MIAGIKAQLKLFNNVPELSSHFESSVPGLFFVGPAAVNSFGPVLRFACGAGFTASRLSNYLARTSRLTKRWTAGAPLQCAPFPEAGVDDTQDPHPQVTTPGD